MKYVPRNEYFELILSKFKARKIKFPTLKPENDQILIYNQSITKKISGYYPFVDNEIFLFSKIFSDSLYQTI